MKPILPHFLMNSNPVVHNRAIDVVRNLMTSHDTDPRYTLPDVRARVASLYLPLISVIMDALPQLYDPLIDRRRGAFLSCHCSKILSK